MAAQHADHDVRAHARRSEEPLRSEILSLERLGDEARSIANAQRWVVDVRQITTPLADLVQRAAADLTADNTAFARLVRQGLPAAPAAEWLLDNHYLIEEQLLLVREDLPRGYARELPRLSNGTLEGYPRIFEALQALIAHTDSRVNEESLAAYVDAYQQVSPLSIGEVWAVPIMLRIGVIENLRRLSRAVLQSMQAEGLADAWAERLVLAAQDEPQQVTVLLGEMRELPHAADARFLLRLSQRLATLEAGAESINTWLAHALSEAGVSLELTAHAEQQLQAANQVSIANAITTVRFLDALDWRAFFEQASLVEATLREDPAQTYARMDFASRDRYRHALEQIARFSTAPEIGLARLVVDRAHEALRDDPADWTRGHVGYWLIDEGRYELERAVGYRPRPREVVHRTLLALRGLYYGGTFGAVLLVLLAAIAAFGWAYGARGWALVALVALSVVPFSDIALAVLNRLSSRLFPPRLLPRLDTRHPIDEAHRTLVIVPALLSSPSGVASLVDELEVAYLANRDPNIGFGILGDLKSSDGPERDDDGHVIEAAVRAVSLLNERYEVEHGLRPFHLLIRDRVHVPSEGAWSGWERKRGALVELVREMRSSGATTFSTKLGDTEFRRSCTFVITLDADTILPRDGARSLICTIAHPLNRAQVEPGDPIVRKGYGLLQPRVGMTLPGASRSRFAQMYSGVTGIDPYAHAVSDTYQDVFGEGSFTGKGIFEVDVFETVLEGRFPENTLLSHDLIEGSFVRTALASDIEVLDNYPANYIAAAKRLHRWVRGDWQTLPYLGWRIKLDDGSRQSNPLSVLHRWKIVDNLRRTLVPPATVLLFTLGWLLMPQAALSWPLVLLALIFFPAYFSLAGSMVFRSRSVSFAATAPAILRDFGTDSARALLSIAVLPHQAWLMLDGTVRALWRRFVSHRLLLEWETAAESERTASGSLESFFRAITPAALLAIAALGAGAALVPVRAVVAVPLALLWLLAPVGAWWVSLPLPKVVPEPLTQDEHLALRRVARKTWRFFERYVTPEGHYFAPDNYQEDPGDVVAWRTSPTNIGLQLMANLGAWDLGYVNVAGLSTRTSDTLAAMAGLERFGGHFYNWYDIRTLEPLRPAYVSTVDSGNLAGHLLVLRVGLLEATEAPLVGVQLVDGMRDTARLALEDLACEDSDADSRARLREVVSEIERALTVADKPSDLGGWHALLGRLERLANETREAAANDACDHPAVRDLIGHIEANLATLATLTPWASLVAEAPQSARAREELAPLLTWVPSLVGLAEGLEMALAALDEMAAIGGSDAAWARAVASGIRQARPACVELLARIRLNSNIAREMWEHTDFAMLYDPHRALFSIGYNLAEGRLDNSFYDLLASECRLASFLAIAKGDVGQDHWFRLGRSLTQTPQGRALVSWSASMFEYLMPALVMQDWPETLLAETCETVVRRQIAYGRERGIPWGVSESAFNAKDASLTYQYQAFGVPGLGLKRGLSSDIVVAPYASLLALPVAPRAVVANLGALAAEGAEGVLGFYEALDYTPGRVPAGLTRAVVRSYFAHHQGMSFIALANTLDGARMQERFHADPLVASVELLLQERVPRHVQLVSPHVEEVREVTSVRELPATVARTYLTAHTPSPATHFLSNGTYSVMVTNAGGGYSRWQGTAVSRYREDVTRDCWGTFIYLRDTDTGESFAVPHNPRPGEPDNYVVTFAPDKAEYRRHDGDIESALEIAVSPEDDVEIRRVAITNHGRSTRHLDLTSYFEIALTAQAADQAHKSFSNLFVETEALDETSSLLFTRRPRSADEDRIWGLHLATSDHEIGPASYTTDRAAFLGRLRGADCPAALDLTGPLDGAVGAVLDPCCAIRRSIEVPPEQTVRVVFVTGAAPDRDTAVRLTEKYADAHSAQRAIDLAWTAARLEQRDLGISAAMAVTLDRLASRLLLTDAFSPLKIKTPVENGLQMSGLWSLGISGDLPILLVRVEELEHAPLVRQALLAHQYWRHKGLVADLVILNTRPTGYTDDLDDRLRLLMRTGHALQMLDKPGGVFLRRADQMHPDILNLLLTVARATLEGSGGTIELQLNRRGGRPQLPEPFVPAAEPREDAPLPFTRPDLLFDNGLGGFDAQTGEYVIVLEGDDVTPAPWINVLANPDFGCTVSEAGIGCSWAANSHENRITTWNNDPVSDGSGEALFIRDEETGEVWSPTPAPVRTPGPYVVRHGRGYTRFEHDTHGISHALDWFVSATEPVRVCRLTLANHSERARSLSVTQLVEWVLGDSRSKAQQLVVTWFDDEIQALTAHNHFNMDFPGRCAFLACDRPLHSWTASRAEFVGRNQAPWSPDAMRRAGLAGISGRFHDNCGALMTTVDLGPGESAQVSFFLGQTECLESSRALIGRLRSEGAVEAELAGAREFWRTLLDSVQVKTPDTKLDLLVNGPLLYQATACRLWGRTATYQSSGAFGFRDQLQDVMSLLYARPELVRDQIIEAARHQFPEGDVLHWWQPHSGRGVRTHFKDDRHWLPLVVAEYVDGTGDSSVLAERATFVEGPILPLESEDLYLHPAISEHAATVYEHCVRALETGRPVGAHGLPLMGGGDWNDGMNRVGHGGKGESVWLAWFLGYTLNRFAPICESMGEHDRAADYRQWALDLAQAAEKHAWDGGWYRRAFFDDGTPLGTRDAEECRIDAIAQAWATISGLADPERAEAALESVEDKLVRHEEGIIALLTPPFDKMDHDPGYIKGYVPGVRENGGQYTHAALWTVLAFLMRGDGDEAANLLDLINPISHATDRASAQRYMVEPYVVAADVYAAQKHLGRGGWTWYTGSASWFYRVAVTNLLGLSVKGRPGEGRYLSIDPCIPKRWSGFEMWYRAGSSTYHIAIDNPRGVNRGVARVELDGAIVDSGEIPVTDDGATHEVKVVMLGG